VFNDPSIVLVLFHPGVQLVLFVVGVPLWLIGQSLWQGLFPPHPLGPHRRQHDCRDVGCSPQGEA